MLKKHEADISVLKAVKEEAELFLDRDKLSKQVIKRNYPLSASDNMKKLKQERAGGKHKMRLVE